MVVERILAVDKYYQEEICPLLAEQETIAEKLRTFCLLVFRHMEVLGKNDIKTAYYIQIGPNPKVSGTMTENRDLYRILAELIAEGQEKGEFRSDLNGTDLAKTVMHNIRGVSYDWCLPSSRFGLEEEGAILLAVLCAGLKVPGK